MNITTKTLYETDFVEWADTMAALLRAGRRSEIHVENVAEEIEDLGKAVLSQLKHAALDTAKNPNGTPGCAAESIPSVPRLCPWTLDPLLEGNLNELVKS